MDYCYLRGYEYSRLDGSMRYADREENVCNMYFIQLFATIYNSLATSVLARCSLLYADEEVLLRSRGIPLPFEHTSWWTWDQPYSCRYSHHIWQWLGMCFPTIHICVLYICKMTVRYRQKTVEMFKYFHFDWRTLRQTCRLRIGVTVLDKPSLWWCTVSSQ